MASEGLDVASARKEAMFLVCFCRASGFCWKEASNVCVMEEVDRELILKEINRSSQGIIHESWSRWEGEARGRQLSKQKEACPKDTRRTASRKRNVNSISPIQQNSVKNGYDENNGYGKER